MATNTARVGLRKPDDADNVIVLTDINNNNDKVDAHLGLYVCTSSTRPVGTDRFTGRTILETDTTNRYYWTGTDWFLINKLYKRKIIAESVSSITLQDDNDIFFSLDPGTWLIEYHGHATGDAGNDIGMEWSFSGTTPVSSRSVIGPAGSGGDTANTIVNIQGYSITSTAGYALDTSDTIHIYETLILDVTVAGVLRNRWARLTNTVPGTPTVLSAGTRATAERVA